ncbi:MAG: ABC transporter substrate-binding protein [Methylobacterium sp.]|uniref:ABC transporter substrate-binding protein n=1 Tax=Methylobacterium sp. TaxID=409 RepID=UPI0025D54DF7|nr:ABC transporter substrate-binding protein [Methylobacterium sp.]MBX9930883.1 ABC transporter substrate-binding protein [Methylobacterium sp.]
MISGHRRSSPGVGLLLAAFLAAGPSQARTLVFCSEGNPESLDPAVVTTTTAMNATWQVFNNLVEFVPGTTEIRPALAESWTITEDGRTYVFALREGVRFHGNARFEPSRAMNADDVVFSFMRQWKPEHRFRPAAGSAFTYFHDLGLADQIVAIDKVGARHVRFILKQPDATFLANLAQAFGGILSAEYADILATAGMPEELARAPIGTGPFVFTSYRPDVAIRYRSFPDYWRKTQAGDLDGAKPIDGLVFSITSNAAVRLTKLKAGECQVMAFPAPADLEAIRTDGALTLLARAELNVGYLALNTTRPPLTDVRVRRAINLAIDKSAIVQGVYGAAGTIAKNPLPPGMWAYDDTLPDIAFDRAEAKRLLIEAGFADGFETDLWFLPVSRPYNPNGRRVGDMIQADLARIGIRTRLMTDTWSAYQAALYRGVPTMMLNGWTSDNGDPDNFLNVLLGCKAAQIGGANLARWCDVDYEAAIQEARRTLDREARTRLYRLAQAIFRREAPWVPLAHTLVHMAVRGDVVGFQMDPLGRHLFEEVRLKD